MDLSPAKWIWFPSQRTLANTFVLFRRELSLDAKPKRAKGWVVADSRYRLTVNGERVQWGPAPSDPRHLEVDPVDLGPYLRVGKNVIGVEVLFFGHGDGTWPCGKPGLLFRLEIESADPHPCPPPPSRGGDWPDSHADPPPLSKPQTPTLALPRIAGEGTPSPSLTFPRGRGRELLVSDSSWRCLVDRGHRPGQYKRSYLRALQEEFDARLHPSGWDKPDFVAGAEWMAAMELDLPASRSPFSGPYSEYINEVWMTDPASSTLTARTIPLMREEIIPGRVVEMGEIEWLRDPADWFEFRTPGSYGAIHPASSVGESSSELVLPAPATGHGRFMTFLWPHEIVGWPCLTVDAPRGTVIEMIAQESVAEGQHWLDTHHFAWSRFICAGGVQVIEPFDYEAFRFVQLHIHGTDEPVTISNVSARRRLNAWPHEAQAKTGDMVLQKLFDAALNTLDNSAQDICVDGMGRERQQYSGDVSHQLHAVRSVYGSVDVSRRFLRTFAQGQNLDGYWFDSWPAYDRMARLWQRQLGASEWGPLLDHSVGFCFDHYHHWMQTGDLETVRENWPRLMKFVDYLQRQMTGDPKGLMPVSGLGEAAVWMDHLAYENQEQKRLAYNLYAGAMLREALFPLAGALGRTEDSEMVGDMGNALIATCQRHYWDSGSKLFVNNLGSGLPHQLDDRSSAMAVLYDLCPGGDHMASVEALVRGVDGFLAGERGTDLEVCATRRAMGMSYPANAIWRHWALAKVGRMDVVLREYRERWATMYSVQQGGTIQEFWDAKPGGVDLMSHCAVSPLIMLHQGLLGLRPLAPGYRKIEIRPQLCDLPSLETTAYIPQGAVHFKSKLVGGRHHCSIMVPAVVEAHLRLPDGTHGLATGRENEFVVDISSYSPPD